MRDPAGAPPGPGPGTASFTPGGPDRTSAYDPPATEAGAVIAGRCKLLDYAAGRFADAAATTQRAIAPYETEPDTPYGFLLFEPACCHAMQAALAGKDGSGVPAADGPAEADRAIE